jgi:hypothetical protein
VVRVVPGLFPKAWRRGLMQPLRVWHLLRTLDWDACGRLDKVSDGAEMAPTPTGFVKNAPPES